MATALQLGFSSSKNLPRLTQACTVTCEGQFVSEPGGENLARRRYQRGQLLVESGSWVARWREDVIEDGIVRRVRRSEVLGNSDKMTRKLALRELETKLLEINDPLYRARPAASLRQFAQRWRDTVLTQHKPSTALNMRTHLDRYLIPFFGQTAIRDVRPESVQRFVASLTDLSPKTVKNILATFRLAWKSARAWGYVNHDVLDGIVLPKACKPHQLFFTIEEIRKILAAASEPQRTFYWLAAETGLRAGELCGLRLDDLDLETSRVTVRQSSWRGKLQDPKSESAFRSFSLSPQLCERLRSYFEIWRPNAQRLLFATRHGSPWDANLLVKRKLHPILDQLKIPRCGLHAFRHANSTLMDRLGVPIKVRQQRLGHSDPRLTLNVYTHVAGEDDVRVAAQFGDMLEGILDGVGRKLKKEGPAQFEQALIN